MLRYQTIAYFPLLRKLKEKVSGMFLSRGREMLAHFRFIET